MSTSRQKQVHLSNLGITISVIYDLQGSLCGVGLAVMSPVDRIAQQLANGKDPWQMARGAEIATGRALTSAGKRRSTALRGLLPEDSVDLMLTGLIHEDENLVHLLDKVAKPSPTEQLFTRFAGVVRALRLVPTSIPLGRTWDRRCALVFGPFITATSEVFSAAG